MEKLIKACELPDEEIVDVCLKCLTEFATQEYQTIEPYFMELARITEACTKSKSSKIGAQAFEFWTSIANTELKLIQRGHANSGFIGKVKDNLLLLIFQGL